MHNVQLDVVLHALHLVLSRSVQVELLRLVGVGTLAVQIGDFNGSHFLACQLDIENRDAKATTDKTYLE